MRVRRGIIGQVAMFDYSHVSAKFNQTLETAGIDIAYCQISYSIGEADHEFFDIIGASRSRNMFDGDRVLHRSAERQQILRDGAISRWKYFETVDGRVASAADLAIEDPITELSAHGENLAEEARIDQIFQFE